MHDIWHYPRSEPAAQIIRTLAVGLVSAVAIIEPRRRGKTTFLLDDLAPAARRDGYLPIYINLTASTGDLEDLLASSVGAAAEGAEGLVGRLRKVGETRIKKLSAKGNVASGELGGEVEFDRTERRGSLRAAFLELARIDKPVLFLLDEVHKLADEGASAVSWSLRSLLDTHRKRMKVVATSSSAASYEVLVTGEKKAFNRWFTRVPLPPLGDAFVEHLAAIVRQHFPRHAIALPDIRQAFAELGHSPKFVRDYLNLRILHPALSHAGAMQEAVAEAARESGYEDQFARLIPLQKTILVALVSGQSQLFSEDTLKAIGSVLTGEPIAKTLMQRALRSLADKGWIIKQGRGDYTLTDVLFVQWLQEQIRAGLLAPPNG
ncbi:hypothetical protein OOT46_20870 [Aquabacterium sp. A7-Y]|uniref:hypothetical protein n=1 Tax=Aquabacterium sp. A7-Y TaxID=1349605 RepID=UPI00223E5D79|nr:hypothetical protein [Aquabacterium sp. A7-Y]MCW7540291.1 hypothetical protein [Aquabacterium sp. A7-Y]